MGKRKFCKTTKQLNSALTDPTNRKVSRRTTKIDSNGIEEPGNDSLVDIVNVGESSKTNAKEEKHSALRHYRNEVFSNFVDSSEESASVRNQKRHNSELYFNDVVSNIPRKDILDNAEIVVVDTDATVPSFPSSSSDCGTVTSDVCTDTEGLCEKSDMSFDCCEMSEISMESGEEELDTELDFEENIENLADAAENSENLHPSELKDLASAESLPLKTKDYIFCTRGQISILVMAHSKEICFRGKAKMHAVHGSCKISGYEVKSGQTPVEIFSPLSNSYLTIRSVSGEDKDEVRNTLKNGEEFRNLDLKSFVHTMFSHLPLGDCTLLIFRKIYSPVNNYISSIPTYSKLFVEQTKYKNYMMPFKFSTTADCEKLFVSISQEYETVMKEWENRVADGEKPFIMVVGGKDSGKSTLNRMLINSALNVSDSVDFLDCDVGQSEFTPPGFISLHKISDPILGPPFTHQRNSELMCFFGEISPARGLTRYIKIVEFIHSEYIKRNSGHPLVINTLGWNEGLGLKIIVDLIHMIRPTIIVQLSCFYQYRNFPMLTSDYLTTTAGWLYNKNPRKSRNDNPGLFDDVELFLIDSDAPVKVRFPYSSLQLRDLSIISYLSSGLNKGRVITNERPARIAFRNIAIHDCQNPGDYSQILYAFNASVVALCHIDFSTTYTIEETSLKFVRETPICLCYGLGIVRAIDVPNEYIYLITPMPYENLAKVNCLVKGAVATPDIFFTQQINKMPHISDIPYVGKVVKSVGSTVLNPHSRKPRKQYLPKEDGPKE